MCSRSWTHIHNNILTDQYNGFVTLKDFELPDDVFDWEDETCWSDWSVINYPELICAFCWFIFLSSLLKMHGPKNKITLCSLTYYMISLFVHVPTGLVSILTIPSCPAHILCLTVESADTQNDVPKIALIIPLTADSAVLF